MAKSDLQKAKEAKKDEFYTQLSDIENELKHYKEHFKDKVIFCNCDDPKYSNFHRYFRLNFEVLGLKSLITTHYNKDGESYAEKLTREMVAKNKEYISPSLFDKDTIRERNDFQKNPPQITLKQGGDFRSDECIKFLKQSDIVVTNPPFSLFREYVAQLVEYDKKFVIIGNQNAITYKEIFKLIKNNQIWLGSSLSYCAFKVPSDYEEKTTRFWIDDNGQKWRSMGNICWFTNLDIKKRHENLETIASYYKDSSKYPKYDNYDAINVDKTSEIPLDYEGVMGVPITFLDKHNPEQFEILAEMATTKIDEYNFGYPYVNGSKKFARILIKNKNPKEKQ